MAELGEAIDAFDRLVATAAGNTPEDAVERAALVARRVRNRRGYAGSTVVVALAGGTGSGKSSLVNALAGEDVARSGALRPTTSDPQAWIPVDPEPGLIRLLDDVGIVDRVGQDRHAWLAVIDLPDTDSVEVEHRQTVARLLPHVDAVAWVLDPEKYQDRVLHAEHLAPLAEYREQFLFVLNQVDRLTDGQVPHLVDDLRATLRGDGIPDPVILATAADPELGPPIGIDDLLLALRGLGDAKAVIHRKLVTDLAVSARDLSRAAGVEGGRGTGFTAEWDSVLTDVSGRITDDVAGKQVLEQAGRAGRSSYRAAMSLFRRRAAPTAVELAGRQDAGPGAIAAIRRLDSYVSDLASRLEGDPAAALRAVAGRIDEAVAGAVDSVVFGETVPIAAPPRWTSTVALLRRIAVVIAVIAGLWTFDVVRSGGDLLAPVTTTGVAVLTVVVAGALGAGVGGRRAIEAVSDQREAIARSVAREIDRRLGRPLREVLRRRADVAAALAEFEFVMLDLDDVPPRPV